MTLFGIISIFASILGALIPVVLALEVLFFFWTVAVLILRSGSEDMGELKTKLLWGAIAIFVTVSVWGIINFASYVLDTRRGAVCSPPQIFKDGVITCFE